MSLFENPLKSYIDNRTADYRSISIRYQDMMMQVVMEGDKALMTFSMAGLAALAALNDAIFKPYGWLSFFSLLCFILVVIVVTIGYYVSRALLKDAQRILTDNYKESIKTPLNKNAEKVKFAKVCRFLNFFSMFFFIIAMILFVILMALYIKGLGV